MHVPFKVILSGITGKAYKKESLHVERMTFSLGDLDTNGRDLDTNGQSRNRVNRK